MLGQVSLGLLATGGAWRWGIGDPGLVGWGTVSAYAVAIVCCLWTCRRRAGGERQRGWGVWLMLAALMFLLGLNKQLDFQTLLTQVARDWARQDGWYPRRDLVRVWFVGILLACWLVGTGLLGVRLRRAGAGAWIALTGVLVLGAYIGLRAAVLQKVDVRWLEMDLTMPRLAIALELTGIAMVILGALLARRPRPQTLETCRDVQAFLAATKHRDRSWR